MKKVICGIGRFLWSGRSFKILLWTGTLIILFYAEEDWRGARAWTATKSKWEARGESFDPQRLIPPRIPASENLIALSLFSLESDPSDGGRPEPLALRRALDVLPPQIDLPTFGNWQRGESPDSRKIGAQMAACYLAVFHHPPVPGLSMLQQFEAIYPFVPDLRRASRQRPLCDFPQDYDKGAGGLTIELLTEQIRLVRLISADATLALLEKEPALALDDVLLCLQIDGGLRRQPILVSELCSIAVNATLLGPVSLGLGRHDWDDAQLARLEKALQSVDFLSSYQCSLHGEFVLMNLPVYDSLAVDRNTLKANLAETRRRHPDWKFTISLLDLWPSGWFDLLKAHLVDTPFTAARLADPAQHRIYPDATLALTLKLEKETRPPTKTLSGLFAGFAFDRIEGVLQKFAVDAVWIDQARIACGLERYRNVHGAYPAQLLNLVPAFLAQVPHDIFKAEPYRYALRSDGSYLLYSIGWNQKDDGGRVIPDPDHPKAPGAGGQASKESTSAKIGTFERSSFGSPGGTSVRRSSNSIPIIL